MVLQGRKRCSTSLDWMESNYSEFYHTGVMRIMCTYASSAKGLTRNRTTLCKVLQKE